MKKFLKKNNGFAGIDISISMIIILIFIPTIFGIVYNVGKTNAEVKRKTKAISIAHDIGHSPFGHQGEKILSEISKRDLNKSFWHEKNGLEYVDKIELLETPEGKYQNLDLTYGVRDGIISHCGEIDEISIKPRTEYIDLNDYEHPNPYAPYTWEGCVVKIADKLSYLGRDIADAITLGILDEKPNELYDVLKLPKDTKINNTIILNTFIKDLCENSNLEQGLCFSKDKFEMINCLKEFNYKNIYFSDRIIPSNKFFYLVINQIYDKLKNCFEQENTLSNIKRLNKFYPKLSNGFYEFLQNYSDFGNRKNLKLKNQIIFDYKNKEDFYKSIISYISGMTDNFAIEIYNEIIRF